MKNAFKTTVWFVILAIVLAAFAALVMWKWKAENRDVENSSIEVLAARQRAGWAAEAAGRLVDRLEALRLEAAVVAAGSPEDQRIQEEIREVSNLIAAEMPALAYEMDEQGNAVIVGVEMARNHINTILEAVP